ncbi:MAG: ABC transporter permease [Stomatobaculum sp.]|nr:ABC transporter permease [Stomatobaculum sp.]
MIADMLISAFGQGFIYAPMALGVFLSFGILKTPDLSVEGSFVFGMTVCAQTAILGHPGAALFTGILAGALAGACTGLLQTKLKIEAILSGILTMTGLYTVNYAILGGQSNRYLQRMEVNAVGVEVPAPVKTVYKLFQTSFGQGLDSSASACVLTGILVAVTAAILIIFFRTRRGMAIIATGDNEEMVRSSSINADAARIGGMMLSNALVGFSGALLCQYQQYADLNCGTGMMVMGLASVVIGTTLFGKQSVTKQILWVVAGSLIYRLMIQAAYKIDLPSYSVKLLSVIIVIASLAVPRLTAAGKKAAVQRGGERK